MSSRPLIIRICRQRVDQMVTQEELTRLGLSRTELVEQIAATILRNLASGRAQRVMAVSADTGQRRDTTAASPTSDPLPPTSEDAGRFADYVDRVIATYLQEHVRVERLVERDEATWTNLFEQLTNRAYRFLQRRQVPAARAADEARDFAQQACERIYNAPFPFDAPFDAWATRILFNEIRQRDTRSRDLTDRTRGIISLDLGTEGNDFSLYEVLFDPASSAIFEQLEIQIWLLRAIDRLRSRAQQQVIIYTYFDELSDAEIAQRLGKSRQAIYNLRHRALRKLKKILENK